ncbi:hypothetical protein VPH35_068078 [Triticum aestivum]
MGSLQITHFLPFKLDFGSGDCAKWKDIMRYVLSMYDAEDHITHFTPPLERGVVWRNADVTILLWIYGTVADELYEVIRGADNTAYTAWSKLDSFFLDNQAGRAVHLGAKFRNLQQGDMCMAEYCRRLKALAGALADVDEEVTDRALTLQLLRGLSRRYQIIATVLPMQNPFPTFVQARSRLLLEEISLNARDRFEGTTAVAIGIGNSSGNASGGSSSGGSSSAPSDDRDKAQAERGGYQPRGRGQGRGTYQNGNQGGRGQAHLMPGGRPLDRIFCTVGCALSSIGACSLGASQRRWRARASPRQPCSRLPHDLPRHGFFFDSSSAAAAVVGSGRPDRRHAQPVYAAAAQPGGQGDWYLDSGASAHVTGNPGSGHPDPAHELQ